MLDKILKKYGKRILWQIYICFIIFSVYCVFSVIASIVGMLNSSTLYYPIISRYLYESEEYKTSTASYESLKRNLSEEVYANLLKSHPDLVLEKTLNDANNPNKIKILDFSANGDGGLEKFTITSENDKSKDGTYIISYNNVSNKITHIKVMKID